MSKYIKLDDAIEQIRAVFYKDEYQEWLAIAVDNLINRTADLPTIEVCEDCISRATALEIYSDLYWIDERLLNFKSELDKVYDDLRNAPSVIPKEKEVIYGNEHNCIMTLFGECSYSETGCGDCAVVEKVRDALAKTQIKTQNSNVISVYDGVSEAVRCAMCSNPNKSDRGCDGACSYDERLYERIMKAIAESVIPQQEEGEWIRQGISPHEGIQICSLCGAMYDITAEFDNCPNCHAKMKGADDDI